MPVPLDSDEVMSGLDQDSRPSGHPVSGGLSALNCPRGQEEREICHTPAPRRGSTADAARPSSTVPITEASSVAQAAPIPP